MCGHKVVAEQMWVLVQARPHLLAETLRKKMGCAVVTIFLNSPLRPILWDIIMQMVVKPVNFAVFWIHIASLSWSPLSHARMADRTFNTRRRMLTSQRNNVLDVMTSWQLPRDAPCCCSELWTTVSSENYQVRTFCLCSESLPRCYPWPCTWWEYNSRSQVSIQCKRQGCNTSICSIPETFRRWSIVPGPSAQLLLPGAGTTVL